MKFGLLEALACGPPNPSNNTVIIDVFAIGRDSVSPYGLCVCVCADRAALPQHEQCELQVQYCDF